MSRLSVLTFLGMKKAYFIPEIVSLSVRTSTTPSAALSLGLGREKGSAPRTNTALSFTPWNLARKDRGNLSLGEEAPAAVAPERRGRVLRVPFFFRNFFLRSAAAAR